MAGAGAGADEAQVVRCAYGCQDTACTIGERGDEAASRSVRSYRPHGSLARVLYDKRKADEWLATYDKCKVSATLDDTRPLRFRDPAGNVGVGAGGDAACTSYPAAVALVSIERAPSSRTLAVARLCLPLAARHASLLGSLVTSLVSRP